MTTISFPLPCAACNADLAGVELDATCPACDWPVAATIRVDALDPATSLVCEDAPCLSCGYNLRTLPLGAVCPECGRPVVASLHSNVFLGANRRWDHRIYTGVTLLLVTGIGVPIVLLVPFLMSHLTYEIPIAIELLMAGVLLYLPMLFFAIAFPVGVWLVTAAEHDALKDASLRWYRWIARASIVTLGLEVAYIVVSALLGNLQPLLYSNPAIVAMASLAVAATFRTLRCIAIRTRPRTAARCCHAASWLAIVSGALLVAARIMFLNSPMTPPAPGVLFPLRYIATTTLSCGLFITVVACLVGNAALLLWRKRLLPARAQSPVPD